MKKKKKRKQKKFFFIRVEYLFRVYPRVAPTWLLWLELFTLYLRSFCKSILHLSLLFTITHSLLHVHTHKHTHFLSPSQPPLAHPPSFFFFHFPFFMKLVWKVTSQTNIFYNFQALWKHVWKWADLMMAVESHLDRGCIRLHTQQPLVRISAIECFFLKKCFSDVAEIIYNELLRPWTVQSLIIDQTQFNASKT